METWCSRRSAYSNSFISRMKYGEYFDHLILLCLFYAFPVFPQMWIGVSKIKLTRYVLAKDVFCHYLEDFST